MLRKPKPESCHACGTPIERDRKVCVCGIPTPYITFEERAAYELAQWRLERWFRRAS